jgi:hypothetical protein
MRARANLRKLALGALLASACGGSDVPITAHRGFGDAPPDNSAPAAAPATPTPAPAAPAMAAGAGANTQAPASQSAVPASLRPKLGDEDFTEDPTGDIVRDPFRSFLIPAGGAQVQAAAGPTHETLMSKYRLADLKLEGIIREGSVHKALFATPDGYPYLVERTNYISSDDAYVDLIDDLGVVVTIGATDAAPPPVPPQGSQTPAPEEVTSVRIPLHPEDLTPTSTGP